MDYNYKLIIYGSGFYHEIPLEETENGIFCVGTYKHCNVRFDRDRFFDDIMLEFIKTEYGWKLMCGDNIYIDSKGIMKLHSMELIHGTDITLKYKESKSLLFHISFLINFDNQDYNYDRAINISGRQQISIGGREFCDIYITNPLVKGDALTLIAYENNYKIIDNDCKNGIYINGSKMSGTEQIIHDSDFFMLDGAGFYLSGDCLYTSKQDFKKLNGLSYVDVLDSKSFHSFPQFMRNVRIRRNIKEETIEVLMPKPAPQKDKKNILMSIIPSIITLVLMISIRGSMSSNKMFIMYSGAMMLMGIVTSFITYFVNKRQYKKDVEHREQQYTEYINEKETEIKNKREKELEILNDKYYRVEEELQEVFDFDTRLFERTRPDDDFLTVRLGTGKVRSLQQVEYTKQEFKDTEDKIMDYPEKLANSYEYIDNAPIVLELRECNTVGFVGTHEALLNMVSIITTDLSVTHFYDDIKMFYVFDEKDKNFFYGMRWLKNITCGQGGVRNFIYDEESVKYIFENIYKELLRRESIAESAAGDIDVPYFVIFIVKSESINNHPISRYYGRGRELKCIFIFLEEHRECIPMEADRVITLTDNSKGLLVNAHDGDMKSSFMYNHVNMDAFNKAMLKLGSVYVNQVSVESTLHNITLFEMLDIMKVDDLDLKARWAASQVYKSMAAPLGIRGNETLVYLDLSDKKHGPHGLVAGTTGSGKSEIIQSYILSMATLFHPYDVGFMIIDFKGGGMANQFKDLPHLIGTITNIDGREINRSLLSIKAELIKRQEIFAGAGVNNISDYIKKYKKGEVTIPMPHLIMVCDEFAELKAEYPDFMKEIVSAARIGRTLGVHLILATQKPAGVVDNQIWSNSKFKLCLKVQTKEDSNEVIKSPLAAEIKEPGRAYFQVGNNEIFELFQSAYSGAKASNAVGDEKTFELKELNLWGKRKVVFSNKKKDNDDKALTQLEAIVKYTHDYCEAENIKRLPGICQPPLKDVLYMKEISSFDKTSSQSICVNIGIYDDPEQQLQKELTINLSDSNVYIAGASQMGKTTMIQTILYNLLDKYSPEDINIYIIDCGNMALKIFEEAKQVGGVVLGSEEEKLVNLFKMLQGFIEERKEIFSKKGLGTFSAYIEAGFKDVPQILVILDNVAVFREQYADYFDILLSLSRNGISVGINLIVTGTQANSFGFKALANYGTRLVLFCTEKAEYANLFGRCRIEPKETAGRGLCVIDKQVKEFQTALAFEGNKEIERVENMKKFITNNSVKYTGSRARIIPVVPKMVVESVVMKNNPELYSDLSKLPYAIDYANVDYQYIDLMAENYMVITGGEGKGKTNLTKLILNHFEKNIFEYPSNVYILDNDEGELKEYENNTTVKAYSTKAADTQSFMEKIDEIMIKRQEDIDVAGRSSYNFAEAPYILFVINDKQVLNEIAKKKELQAFMNKFIKEYKKYKFMVLFANFENAAIAFNTYDAIKYIKEQKKYYVFEDMSNIKIVDITPKIARSYSKALVPGDAYYFAGSRIVKIKTFLTDEM